MGRWLPVLGVVAVLGIAAVAASMSSPEITNVPVPGPLATPKSFPPRTAQAPQGDAPLPGDRSGGFELPEWVTYTAGTICALLAVLLIGSLVWYLLKNRGPQAKPRLFVEPDQAKPMEAGAEEEVLAAVEAGLVELSDADADPRRAVIACWVRLERAAAAAGTPRLTGDSPTELVVRLLSGHRVSRRTLEGLADVYREARYATHPVTERSRQDALAALRQLRAELSRVGPEATIETNPGGANHAP